MSRRLACWILSVFEGLYLRLRGWKPAPRTFDTWIPSDSFQRTSAHYRPFYRKGHAVNAQKYWDATISTTRKRI